MPVDKLDKYTKHLAFHKVKLHHNLLGFFCT